MISVAAEDLAASPCIVCGGTPVYTGVWSLTPECVARELAGDPSRTRTLVYRLCAECVNQGGWDRSFVTAVEDAILEHSRTGNVHRIVRRSKRVQTVKRNH